MKAKLFGLVFFLPSAAMAVGPQFSSLTCRSYDYYELAGNRKAVEISLARSNDGTYAFKLFHNFEALVAGQQYKEVSRNVRGEIYGLSCSQADSALDPKIISCTTPGRESYFGLSRVDRNVIGSPSSSKPGEVIKTSVYEGEVFGDRVGEQDGLKDGLQFDPANCMLN